MFDRLLRSGRVASVVALALANAARANTYIVGPGAGADFPDIPSAIVGSQPGDVLLVQAASYAGGFTLDKGLTIIGYGSVQLSGPGVVANVPANQRAMIIHLAVPGVSVDHCRGTVILGELVVSGPSVCSASADVRLSKVTATVPSLPVVPAVAVTDSRVEIAESSIVGCWPGGYGSARGGVGLDCRLESRVHLARSAVRGGDGQWNIGIGQHCGDGAEGIRQTSSSELLIAGARHGFVGAGYGGINLSYSDCCEDGDGTSAIINNVGSLWYSGAVLRGSSMLLSNPCNCSLYTYGPISGPATLVSPADPALSIVGTLTPLSTSILTLRGPVGAQATLEIGRRPVVVPDPDRWVETLVDPAQSVYLGVIPASREVSYSIYDPGWAPGTLLLAQGTIILTSMEIRRTNSVPMVFR